MAQANNRPGTGIGTDRYGGGVIDPTKNVLDLVSAAIKRQDDLRNLESKHTRDTAQLRANYDEKLRKAESARIDAIRAVDVGNVQRAAEVQATQALSLATQVTTSAEALRTQVAAAATAQTIALNAALDPIQKRIDDLTRAQYEAQGQKTNIIESTSKSGLSGMYVSIAVAILSVLISFSLLIFYVTKK
jgi:hypothetical protein